MPAAPVRWRRDSRGEATPSSRVGRANRTPDGAGAQRRARGRKEEAEKSRLAVQGLKHFLFGSLRQFWRV